MWLKYFIHSIYMLPSLYICGHYIVVRPLSTVFLFFTYITYIIGHYNISVRITDLVSQTTYVVGLHFIRKWRDLQFKVNSERQHFMAIFIYSQSFRQKSADRKSPQKYFLYFVFMSGLVLEPWLFV